VEDNTWLTGARPRCAKVPQPIWPTGARYEKLEGTTITPAAGDSGIRKEEGEVLKRPSNLVDERKEREDNTPSLTKISGRRTTSLARHDNTYHNYFG